MSRVSYDGGATFREFKCEDDVTTNDVRKFLRYFQCAKVTVPNPRAKYDHDEDPEITLDVLDKLLGIMMRTNGGSMLQKYHWDRDGKPFVNVPSSAVREFLATVGDVDFVRDIRFEDTWTVNVPPLDPAYAVIDEACAGKAITVNAVELR